jgi:hypothetical protein
MSDPTFTEGQRVFHAELGCYARWMEYVPSEGIEGSDPAGYSRVEMENANGRTLLCPTSTIRPAEETE